MQTDTVQAAITLDGLVHVHEAITGRRLRRQLSDEERRALKDLRRIPGDLSFPDFYEQSIEIIDVYERPVIPETVDDFDAFDHAFESLVAKGMDPERAEELAAREYLEGVAI